MKNYHYGAFPLVMGPLPIICSEFMFYMYLPVKLPSTDHIIYLEPRLEPFRELLDFIVDFEGGRFLEDKYIYLTVKSMFHPKGLAHNRPGWHSDGFGSDDINYIWSDNTPTEFCIQEFTVPADDKLSLAEFNRQAKEENIVTYPDGYLLRLTPAHIHRIGVKKEDGPRLFIKVSISDRPYQLKGNSINPLLDCGWNTMIDRDIERNSP